MILRVALLLTLLMISVNAFAADVYMSTTGTKSSGKSTAGDWSNANCYGNLHAAMAAMSSGDTLTIDDGTYTGSTNSIEIHQSETSYYPPNGTSTSNMTVVRARNIPCQNGVACNQTLRVYFKSDATSRTTQSMTGLGAILYDDRPYPSSNTYHMQYIKFWGIKWDSPGLSWYDNWLYFKQCAFVGVTNGNSTAFSADGHYNLIEDCVAYGKGRYTFSSWMDHGQACYPYCNDSGSACTPTSAPSLCDGTGSNLYRRCIARHDYIDAFADPIATFVNYHSKGTSFVNCIDIDSDQASFYHQSVPEVNGSYSQPVDDSSAGEAQMRIYGSLAINSALGGIWGADSNGNTSGNIVQDFALVKSTGGIVLRGGGSMNRVLLDDLSFSNFTFSGGLSTSSIVTAEAYPAPTTENGISTWNGEDMTVTNSIIRSIDGTAFAGNADGNYINTYSVGATTYGGSTISNGVTTDPYTHGLLYPVRIETGSTLKTTGSSGGQIGPNILYRIGEDGQFIGTTGWNVETATALWPWPNEDWIKAELASLPTTVNGDTMASPTRGVASPTAKQLDGTSDVTLTSYIWESLGNQIPADIYGEETPTATQSFSGVTQFAGCMLQ